MVSYAKHSGRGQKAFVKILSDASFNWNILLSRVTYLDNNEPQSLGAIKRSKVDCKLEKKWYKLANPAVEGESKEKPKEKKSKLLETMIENLQKEIKEFKIKERF